MDSITTEKRRLSILGTRGIPARHGGFETFAEQLALYLAKHDWDVTVYCQAESDQMFSEESWNGIRLVQIPSGNRNALATIFFDFQATLHAAKRQGLILTLGYNTAIFLIWLKLRGIKNLINMDGIEWRRQKWSFWARCWLFLNERLAPLFADHLIADHPAIKAHHAKHVAAERISTIPYGAPQLEEFDDKALEKWGLTRNQYVLVVARIEPENSILEIVRGFCLRPRGVHLVVVGNYVPDREPYHQHIAAACSPEVKMIGPVYEPDRLGALRFHARLHVHGHRVGGTNPSLVEALGAGNAVLAHDNPFNRWVAGSLNAYFYDAPSCSMQFDTLLHDLELLQVMRCASRKRHMEAFLWPSILEQYENLLEKWHPVIGLNCAEEKNAESPEWNNQ